MVKSEMDKLKFVKVKQYDDENFIGTYITTPADAYNLIGEINEWKNGRWTANVVWLTQAEYDALPNLIGINGE